MKSIRLKLLSSFPWLRKQVSTRDIKLVLGHYHLKTWRVTKRLDGLHSSNFVLSTTEGDKLLKCYNVSINTVIYEHFLTNYLNKCEFACPDFVRTTTGSTYCVVEGRVYALYEFIEGTVGLCNAEASRYRLEQIQLAAEKLALLHQLFRNLDTEMLPVLPGRDYGGWPGDLRDHLVLVDHFSELIRSFRYPRAQVQAFDQISEGIKCKVSEGWQFYTKSHADLPKQIVHYDYAPKNLIFGTSGVTVLDFGEAHMDFRVADIARALTSFSFRQKRTLDVDIGRAFMSKYSEITKLTNVEITSIKTLLYLRVLRSMLRLMEVCIETKNKAYLAGVYQDPLLATLKKWNYVNWLVKDDTSFHRTLASIAASAH